jgi:uncharacterized integral membrane protein
VNPGVHFSSVHGQLSLGVALLLAAICGAAVAVPGYGRIRQLRKAARRNVGGPSDTAR